MDLPEHILTRIGRPLNRRFPELMKFMEEAPPEVVRELAQLERELDHERARLKRKIREPWRR